MSWGKVIAITIAVSLAGWVFAQWIHTREPRLPCERERMRW